MNQKQFTDYIVPRLRAIFPQSKQYQIDSHIDVAYLEIPSRLDELTILISTRDIELTFGFSAGTGLFFWHSHLYAYPSIDDKISAAVEGIKNILEEKKGIFYSSVLGPFPGELEDMADVNKYKQEDETIEFKHWSDF